MSASSNLDLVRSIFASWEQGDFSSSEWADPEIEFVATGGIEQRRSVGLAAMGEAWRDVLAAWKGFRVVTAEYREVDDGRVLALVRHRGEGKTSGADAGAASAAAVFQVRDGRVTRLVVYGFPERAFADLGLAPD